MSIFRRGLMMAKVGGSGEIKNYFCTTAIEDTTFNLGIGASITTTNYSYAEYSLDGKSWTKVNNVANTAVDVSVTVLANQKVYWRGIGNTFCGNNTWKSNFSSTGNFSISGNIMSLMYGDDFENKTTIPASRAFQFLFQNNTKLISCDNLVLPATSLTTCCYSNMFFGCSNLTSAAFALPAQSLKNYCYASMFNGCSKLETPPTIATITSLGTYCCENMFKSCAALTAIELNVSATTATNNSFSNIFSGCTTAAIVVRLDTLTLASSSYYYAFYYAKGKLYVRMLATDISASNCLNNWMNGVTNNSNSTFVKHIDATWTNTGNSGVPTNWTLLYYNPSTDKYYLSDKTTECDDHGNVI